MRSGGRRKVCWVSKFSDGKEYLTVKEAAALLRRSTTSVYRNSAPDLPDPLPCIRIGRALLYEAQELRTWIDSHRSSLVVNFPSEMATLETGGFECLESVTKLVQSVSEVRVSKHSIGRGRGGRNF